jgi:transcription elongation factor Elf1
VSQAASQLERYCIVGSIASMERSFQIRLRGLKRVGLNSKAYQVVFECPKGGHKVRSEVEAKKMFDGEEISCGHCGWHGKVSKMRLRQIVPFNWVYSPTA